METDENTNQELALFDLTPPFSTDELQERYRDLVQVWHPDRHAHNERLRQKAEEQLKRINAAYENLRANCDSINSHFHAKQSAPRPKRSQKNPAISTLDKQMRLADAAAKAGNMQSAYKHYSKALEEDPSCHLAWLGKGTAAGWLSTFFEPRLTEMCACYDEAIQSAPTDRCAALEAATAVTRTEIIGGLFQVCKTALHESLPTAGVDQNGTAPLWNHYVGICSQMLSILEQVHTTIPDEPMPMRLIVALCEDLLAGVSYTDYTTVNFGSYTKRAMIIVSPLDEQLRSKMQYYSTKIQAADPSFKTPNPVKASPGCFIATCVCDSPDHHSVVVLRKFRDQLLCAYSTGRRLNRVYQIYGPRLAAQIEGRTTLKGLIRIILIVPAARLAKASLGWMPTRPRPKLNWQQASRAAQKHRVMIPRSAFAP